MKRKVKVILTAAIFTFCTAIGGCKAVESKLEPVYEALLENMLLNESDGERPENSKKIIVEFVVKHGSEFANRQVKHIKWPGKTLLVGVRKGENHLIPKGNTEVMEGDYLTILTDLNSESRVKDLLEEMNEPQ